MEISNNNNNNSASTLTPLGSLYESYLHSVSHVSMKKGLQDRISLHSKGLEQLEQQIEMAEALLKSYVKSLALEKEIKNSEKSILHIFSDCRVKEGLAYIENSLLACSQFSSADEVLSFVGSRIDNKDIPIRLDWSAAIERDVKEHFQRKLQAQQPALDAKIEKLKRSLWAIANTGIAFPGDSDNELIELSAAENESKMPICPITQTQINEPYRSKTCSHKFEKTAIIEYIFTNGNNNNNNSSSAPCPVAGCRERLTMDSIESDNETIHLIRRIKHRLELIAEQRKKKREESGEGEEYEEEIELREGELDLTQPELRLPIASQSQQHESTQQRAITIKLGKN